MAVIGRECEFPGTSWFNYCYSSSMGWLHVTSYLEIGSLGNWWMHDRGMKGKERFQGGQAGVLIFYLFINFLRLWWVQLSQVPPVIPGLGNYWRKGCSQSYQEKSKFKVDPSALLYWSANGQKKTTVFPLLQDRVNLSHFQGQLLFQSQLALMPKWPVTRGRPPLSAVFQGQGLGPMTLSLGVGGAPPIKALGRPLGILWSIVGK